MCEERSKQKPPNNKGEKKEKEKCLANIHVCTRNWIEFYLILHSTEFYLILQINWIYIYNAKTLIAHINFIWNT